MPYSVIRGALITRKTLHMLTLTALLIALSLPCLLQTVQAQNFTSFTTQDVFEIPVYKGAISFAFNGSYSSAILENDTWTFNNLTFNNTFPLGTLKFSAKNCDVTIYSFASTNFYSRRIGYIRYYVEGGEQAINLGFNSTQSSDPSEWTVVNQDSVFFAEGSNWQLLPNDTLVVHGLSGNLTIARYSYGYQVDNRPFYLQHSVIILTAIAVAITITVATIIKFKTKVRQP